MSTVAMINEEELLVSREEREKLLGRIDVLEKVKSLLLLPALEMATTQQVADFYEVDVNTLYSTINYHKEELVSDGYKSMRGKEVITIMENSTLDFKGLSITKAQGGYLVNGEYKLAYAGVGLFPKRAILRVGMLLRDSEVAKEVRTQLLNIEEKAPEVIRKAEVDTEVALLEQAVGKAFASNDIMKFAEATMKLNAYKDRYTKQVEAKLEETTAIHASSLDCLVTSKSFAERFEYKGIPATSKQLNDILIKAGYVERSRKGLIATDKGRQLGAKVRTGQTDTYKYTYVLWPNRVVEGVFYSIFKENGIDYKTK